MTLVDDIEFYGRAAAAGDMPQAAAAAALVAASNGGLTERGAGGLITDWQAARPRYQESFIQTAALLAKLKEA